MQGSPPAHRTPRPCLRTSGLSWHGTLVPQGAMTSRSNRLLGPETRPCVQSESHSYFVLCFCIILDTFICCCLFVVSPLLFMSCTRTVLSSDLSLFCLPVVKLCSYIIVYIFDFRWLYPPPHIVCWLKRPNFRYLSICPSVSISVHLSICFTKF